MIFFKRLIIVLVLLLVFGAAVEFSLLNSTQVPLNLLVINLEQKPLAAWILFAFVCGGVIGMITCIAMFLRIKKSELMTRHKLRQSQEELKKLRGSVYKA
jgi:uncharacterized membrane protein YciS (DUF1049 family)